MIGLGLRITSGAAHNALPGITAPALTLAGGPVDAPLQPQLNTGAFTLENGAVDTHASTDWQIATDAAFTNIMWSALGSLSLTQITIGLALNETSTYYARARHNGVTFQSKYSAAVMFNTLSVSVTTPAITSPADLATGIAETPAITSSAFAVTNGSDTHASSDWQIASDAGFTTIVAQSLSDATNLESWTVPAGLLLVSSGYFVRVRHTGTAQGPSTWSPGISFTTAAAFGWRPISGASYDNKSVSVSAQLNLPKALAFSADGTKLYVTGDDTVTFLRKLYQYTLTTAWDVSTASYASKLFSFNADSKNFTMTGLDFSSDGTKFYVVTDVVDTVYQYNMSTAWDVSTATFSTSKLISSQTTSPSCISLSGDGTKMYIADRLGHLVYQYTLSTAWSLSTATYVGKSISVMAAGFRPEGVSFSSGGTKMYIAGNNNNTMYEYALSTAWDVSTATYSGISFSVAAQTVVRDTYFGNGGTKFYITGDGVAVYQYSF